MTKTELYDYIVEKLTDDFEVDGSRISLDANLYEDLEIDSIDAVDLLVHVKDFTGKKIPPEQFKDVRTVRDVVDTIMAL